MTAHDPTLDSVLRATCLPLGVGVTTVRPATIEEFLLLGSDAIRTFRLTIAATIKTPGEKSWFLARTGITVERFFERVEALQVEAAPDRPTLPMDRDIDIHFGETYEALVPMVAYANDRWQNVVSAHVAPTDGDGLWRRVFVRTSDGTDVVADLKTWRVSRRDEFLRLLTCPLEFCTLWVAAARDCRRREGSQAVSEAMIAYTS